MDPVAEIKARLPIEQLVGQYCQLKAKGRTFVCLCPFHNDHKPSLLVSPDKGIAYCFSCNSGGDIFSFYQKIEGVDFPQALKDLAEKAGVTLPKQRGFSGPNKDEKEQLRSCMTAAHKFFRKALKESAVAQDYLKKRGIPEELIDEFELGFSPDSFADTYQHLLTEGFSRKEIVAAGLAIQKDLRDERIYDRFRNRIMFPIHDAQGIVIAFGGRTIGADDAKYINSSEGPLYRKSAVLYGLHRAKEAIRETKRVVMVEGYFDLLACWRVGVRNAVAVSGTALTEEHVRILKRLAETVVLCLDADRAGQDAAERAFEMCSKEGLLVLSAEITGKDPDEAAQADSAALRRWISEEARPYLQGVLRALHNENLSSPEVRRRALQRATRLLSVLPSAVDRDDALKDFAAVFGTTATALREDMVKAQQQRMITPAKMDSDSVAATTQTMLFSATEITLGLFLLHPTLRSLLPELIAPEQPFAAALYQALTQAAPGARPEDIELPPELSEHMNVLLLFCEEHGFEGWAESLARMEIRRNCTRANRDMILRKQKDIAQKLKDARKDGKAIEEAQLSTQYQQVLKLSKMAR